jgi:acid ceramidase
VTGVPEIEVDLDVAAEERWASLQAWQSSARALLRFYVNDLGGLQDFRPMLMGYCEEYVDKEYVAEMRGIARVLDAPEEEVVLANLYYDALKFLLGQGSLGCTGFVVPSGSRLLHARNLDWTTANGLLSSETIVFNFRRGAGPVLYRTVGWPGFVGCFSGVAPGRFAVSLNAVLSDDPPELAPPITFVLRRTLETMLSFDEAVRHLSGTKVASDSLLLLSGVQPGEATVIERSPARAAVRAAEQGLLIVTNDYRALSGSAGSEDGCLRRRGKERCTNVTVDDVTQSLEVDFCLIPRLEERRHVYGLDHRRSTMSSVS